MKNQNGISLITLLVTITIMFIITTITIYSGFEAYDNMKVQAFVAKMTALQDKVDVFCDKYSVKEINDMGESYVGANPRAKAVLDELVVEENPRTDLVSWFTLDNSKSNYRYFNIEAIEEKIGLENFDIGIWLNPLTRNVIAVEGVESDGKMYYRQYDLAGGQVLKQPVINNNKNLDFIMKTYDGKADILFDKKYAKVTCYLKNGTDIASTQVFTHVDRITVTESGKYQIIATDYDKKVTDYSEYNNETKNQFAGLEKDSGDFTITLVNKPVLIDGLVPIDKMGRELTTEEEKKDWYNYDSSVKHWANAKLQDGSIYVWIPRFAYKITGKKIEIKFLKDFSTITTEGKSLDNGFRVAPAFQNGSSMVPNSYANGEWDSEISGFWIAKYEATDNDGLPISIVSDNTAMKVAPIIAFTRCRELEKKEVLFGELAVDETARISEDGKFSKDTNKLDTHLMKASEYGAVTYLTYSEYGNFTEDGTTEIRPQEDARPGKYTGAGDPNEVSTTGNETGVFGLSGGTPEIVSAGTNVAGIFNKVGANWSTKYATVYNDINTIFGDAIFDAESSILNSSVAKTFPNEANPIITRGGSLASGNMWIYAPISSTSTASSYRPTLIIEY